jgi:hypothetical protein
MRDFKATSGRTHFCWGKIRTMFPQKKKTYNFGKLLFPSEKILIRLKIAFQKFMVGKELSSYYTANIYDRITMELQSIIVPLLYFAVMFLYI